jgi:hypothetical protein
MFSSDEIRQHLARLEREQAESAADADEPDAVDVFSESQAAAAERAMRFATIKSLLTAEALGTS